MKPVVWMPFRGDGGWRDRNQALAYAQAVRFGFPVLVADEGSEPFSIGRTWNLLARLSPPDWTHAIRWAADFLLADDESVWEALDTDGYTLCSTQATQCNAAETAAIHNGQPAPTRLDKHPFGGVNVVTRDLWETVGGFDPRFGGWGHEDRAFVHCVTTLHGPRNRVPGRLINLWHPRHDTSGYWDRKQANLRLLAEYEAITDPDELRGYLAAR